MRLTMSNRQFELGDRYLGELRAADGIRNDPAALQERMEEDGYLLLRGLQDPETVRSARRIILDHLNAEGRIDTGHPVDQAAAPPDARGSFYGGDKKLTRNAAFLALVESPRIMGFFERFLGAPALTFDYKWLRVTAPGQCSGSHFDICYMGRGTKDLFTVWTPIGDVPYELGPLAILVGSHRLPEFEKVRQTYGKMDVDRDHVTGAFSDDPAETVDAFGGQWQTTEFEAGDVLVFGMYTMHASLTNTSNRYRISSDTRYQRADEPADERWMGADPISHYAWTKGETVPMEEARRRWGV